MEVKELYQFCIWFLNHGAHARDKYQALAQALSHNANQPQKVPVRDELTELRKSLKRMPLQELSNSQMELLEYHGIDGYFGSRGAEFVKKTVMTGQFDPASANTDIQEVINKIQQAIKQTEQIKTGLSTLDFVDEPHSLSDHRTTIRIQFKGDASIEDVAEWKKWSAEWYEIVRGVSMCIGETPEDTHVVGASKGSLIMILAGTPAFTKALAIVSNHLTTVALNILKITNATEDFRHKRLLNKVIETELKKQQADAKKEGMKTIIEGAKAALPADLDGGQEAALTKAIEKYLKFHEKGGEVDFISPPDEDSEDDEADQTVIEQITDIRQNIKQIRETREETKLLIDQSEDDEDDLDEDDFDED